MKSRLLTLTIIFIAVIALQACTLPGSNSGSNTTKFSSSSYISTTGDAAPGLDTRIELEDGAAIVVPANSIDDPISIRIERNPDKVKNLPPMPDDAVQLSDFYDFVINGELKGPVDLVFPFNSELIPERDGVLTVAYPEGEGWKFVPVKSDGNLVTLYTANVGDPIIAWHFIPSEPSYACDPSIALQIVQTEAGYGVVGQVLPVNNRFFGFDTRPAENIEVILDLNRMGWRDQNLGMSFTVMTDEEGRFQQELMLEQVQEGWNWVMAKAECDPWAPQLVVISEGYVEFSHIPQLEAVDLDSVSDQNPDPPVYVQIPEGAILLPDFIGQPIDDVISWLEENSFKYSWIDVSSEFPLGVVANQEPASGFAYFPHRTTVLLSRTVVQEEIIEYPLELVYVGINQNTLCDCAGKCNSMEYTAWFTLFEDGTIEGFVAGCNLSGGPGPLDFDCNYSPSPGYSEPVREFFLSDDYQVITSSTFRDSDYGVCTYEGTYYLRED